MKGAKVRIDKWLHAVRLCKTRTIAAKACEKSKVMVEGEAVKASRTISVGDVIILKDGPINRKYKVLQLAEKRMGAKLVPDFLQDMTSEDDIAKLEAHRKFLNTYKYKGSGRPTKKDRRLLDEFTFFSEEEDW
ncbi:MAG: RNA-binding S4 domain-containing protein [Chitinophagales bacterium]|nr:RNA-binding S4 domain-containing protein [Chitinophagales bacterium]